jgi:hypothetical protein
LHKNKKTLKNRVLRSKKILIYFLESNLSISKKRIESKPNKPKKTIAKALSKFSRFFPNHIKRKQTIAKAEIERNFFISDN